MVLIFIYVFVSDSVFENTF